MPMYDFRCTECGSTRELFIACVEAQAMELVCTACGGPMRLAPSRISHLRTRVTRGEQSTAATSAEQARGGCGHRYACRCAGVRLTRPNPFRDQIKAANEQPPQD